MEERIRKQIVDNFNFEDTYIVGSSQLEDYKLNFALAFSLNDHQLNKSLDIDLNTEFDIGITEDQALKIISNKVTDFSIEFHTEIKEYLSNSWISTRSEMPERNRTVEIAIAYAFMDFRRELFSTQYVFAESIFQATIFTQISDLEASKDIRDRKADVAFWRYHETKI